MRLIFIWKVKLLVGLAPLDVVIMFSFLASGSFGQTFWMELCLRKAAASDEYINTELFRSAPYRSPVCPAFSLN